jgi:hypothetical protein
MGEAAESERTTGEREGATTSRHPSRCGYFDTRVSVSFEV